VVSLVRIEKRSGELEEFDPSKLESSLTAAGASSQDASRVTQTVASSLTEGTDTAQLMMRAATELRKTNSSAANKYENFKSAHPKK
jgi:hypothetical protein